jgi:outer membrane protein
MKRIYILTLAVLLLAGGSATAQEQTLTLQQCIDYAIANSYNIKNSLIDETIASEKVKETTGIGLPQINGSVQLQHNDLLPRFFAMYSTAQNFAGPALDIPGANPKDVVAMQNFFQLKSSGNTNVNISENLSASYFVGLHASKVYKDLASKTTNRTKEQVIESVTKAFYGALINNDRAKLFESNIARVDTLLRNTKALNANGFAESIDVDRIQVTYNNLVTEKARFDNLQRLSIELLKFQMNYPMSQDLGISGTIQDVDVNVDLDSYLNDMDYKNRPDYQVLEVNRKLQDLNLKNTRMANYPTLQLFANLGMSTQSANVAGLFKTETTYLKDQNGIGPDKWYGTRSYGVTLNVPIFSGLQRYHKIQQEKLNVQKLENNYKLLQTTIDFQVKQAAINYQNAVQSLESQQRNMTLAANVAKVTQIKYEQGVGSNLEVVTAESSLREAQVNYYNAMYDAIVAKTDLDKAFGKLLPVNK